MRRVTMGLVVSSSVIPLWRLASFRAGLSREREGLQVAGEPRRGSRAALVEPTFYGMPLAGGEDKRCLPRHPQGAGVDEVRVPLQLIDTDGVMEDVAVKVDVDEQVGYSLAPSPRNFSAEQVVDRLPRVTARHVAGTVGPRPVLVRVACAIEVEISPGVDVLVRVH